MITESIGLSIQITHSDLVPVELLSADGRAFPHERQTIREPKFVSGQNEHFQSPGFTVDCGGVSTAMGTGFGRPHLWHAIRAAKLLFLHHWHSQSPGLNPNVFELITSCFCLPHLKQAFRLAKFVALQEPQFQSPGLGACEGRVPLVVVGLVCAG